MAQDVALPGDPGPDASEPTDDLLEEQPILDPMVTAQMLGRLAYLNYLHNAYKNKGVDDVVLGNIKNQVASNQGINVMAGDEISQVLLDAGISAPGGDNPKDAILPDNLDTIFSQLKSKYGESTPQVAAKIDEALASARQYAMNQNATGNNVQSNFSTLFNQELQKTKGGRMASKWGLVKAAQPVDPLVMEPFQSIEDMKSRLLELGRPTEGEQSSESLKRVYEKVLSMVGPEHTDRAKAAVKSFYQFGKAADLWALFQELGLAAPVDQEVIGEIMQTNPDLFQNQKEAAKAGLFIHAMTKTAGGSVGGAGAGYPAYEFEGSNRYCPKIRNVVNTFICRYHCLDGLKIDDSQVVCGEAIWRQTIADKFSREYRNADGEWVGGYLNKRFEIHRDDGGHPYQLKPGRRSAPIHEDAWSPEKRLVEQRKAKGDADRDDLYNFDQHKLLGGPESSTIEAKPRDPIAKNASCESCNVRTAADPDSPYIGEDPREGFSVEDLVEQHLSDGKPLTIADVKEIILGSAGRYSADDFEEKNGSFWLKRSDMEGDAVTASVKVGKSALDKKFDRCVEKVKGKGTAKSPYAVCMVSTGKGEKQKGKGKKASGETWSIKAAMTPIEGTFNLRRLAVDNGNPLMDGVDMGEKLKACASCGKKFALTYTGPCDNCGCTKLVVKSDGDVKAETHAVDKPEFALDIASSDVEVRYANGVFMASRGGRRAYGESASVAVSKLAAIPQDVGMEEMEEQLKKDESGGEPVAQPPAPAPLPTKTVDTTPTTEDIPMSQVPENPFEVTALDDSPPPTPSELEESAGEPLAEGDDPLDQMEDEENYDELMGI